MRRRSSDEDFEPMGGKDYAESHSLIRDELASVYRSLLVLEQISDIRFGYLSDLYKLRRSLDGFRDSMAYCLARLVDTDTASQVYFGGSEESIPESFTKAFTDEGT